MPRLFGSILVLALTLGTGCQEPAGTASAPGAPGEAIEARSMPEIWLDLLAQRDRLHAVISKGTDMWREDCAEASSAAAALDKTASEFAQRAAARESDEASRRAISDLITYLQQTAAAIRTNAIDEVVGALPGMLIAVDDILQSIERKLSSEETGGQSVTARPGFNPVRPPPPPSPI